MSSLGLFVIGVLITIPSAAVVISLVFAAGIDDRAEKKRLRGRAPGASPSELAD